MRTCNSARRLRLEASTAVAITCHTVPESDHAHLHRAHVMPHAAWDGMGGVEVSIVDQGEHTARFFAEIMEIAAVRLPPETRVCKS